MLAEQRELLSDVVANLSIIRKGLVLAMKSSQLLDTSGWMMRASGCLVILCATAANLAAQTLKAAVSQEVVPRKSPLKESLATKQLRKDFARMVTERVVMLIDDPGLKNRFMVISVGLWLDPKGAVSRCEVQTGHPNLDLKLSKGLRDQDFHPVAPGPSQPFRMKIHGIPKDLQEGFKELTITSPSTPDRSPHNDSK
jgi:hypothetical protein